MLWVPLQVGYLAREEAGTDWVPCSRGSLGRPGHRLAVTRTLRILDFGLSFTCDFEQRGSFPVLRLSLRHPYHDKIVPKPSAFACIVLVSTFSLRLSMNGPRGERGLLKAGAWLEPMGDCR